MNFNLKKKILDRICYHYYYYKCRKMFEIRVNVFIQLKIGFNCAFKCKMIFLSLSKERKFQAITGSDMFCHKTKMN